jgi:hypothetical protein
VGLDAPRLAEQIERSRQPRNGRARPLTHPSGPTVPRRVSQRNFGSNRSSLAWRQPSSDLEFIAWIPFPLATGQHIHGRPFALRKLREGCGGAVGFKWIPTRVGGSTVPEARES